MYLDKVLIKHLNFGIAPKKDLVCVCAFLGKWSLEIKKQLQNAIERTLTYLHLKFSTIFILKTCFLKTLFCHSLVLRAIAATLFIRENKTPFLRQSS